MIDMCISYRFAVMPFYTFNNDTCTNIFTQTQLYNKFFSFVGVVDVRACRYLCISHIDKTNVVDRNWNVEYNVSACMHNSKCHVICCRILQYFNDITHLWGLRESDRIVGL